jgi:ceramide glucosyltransferase
MEHTMTDVARVLLTLGFLGIGLHVVGQACAIVKLRARRRDAAPAYEPGVSILKPIKGVDAELYQNLMSFATQDYARFEILVAIEDPSDPAIPIVRRVQSNFPATRIELITRSGHTGLNPKVNNLLNIEARARYPFLLISDANVRVGPDCLRRTVAPMTDAKVGLVSNPIRGAGADTLGAKLETGHFNTFVISGVCLADRVGIPCVIGKSMLVRRAALDAIGGLRSMRNVLAEDYVIGARMHDAGWRVALADYAVDGVHHGCPWRRFFRRHQRWAQIRMWGEPAAFAVEFLSFASVWLLLSALFAYASSAAGVMTLACAGLATLGAADAVMARRLGGRVEAWVALRPVREFLLLAGWLSALCMREVVWRGRRLRIGRGTTLTPVEETLRARIA